jgi:hypothetical protein
MVREHSGIYYYFKKCTISIFRFSVPFVVHILSIGDYICFFLIKRRILWLAMIINPRHELLFFAMETSPTGELGSVPLGSSDPGSVVSSDPGSLMSSYPGSLVSFEAGSLVISDPDFLVSSDPGSMVSSALFPF